MLEYRKTSYNKGCRWRCYVAMNLLLNRAVEKRYMGITCLKREVEKRYMCITCLNRAVEKRYIIICVSRA